jgi:4-amino-4-deoxy-L-arabinose transferase-like glycosyltransferase
MFSNKTKNIFSISIFLMYITFILFNTFYFLRTKPLKLYFREHPTIYSIFFIIAASISCGVIIFICKKFLFKIKLDKQLPVLLLLLIVTATPRLIWIACIKVTPLSDFNTYHIIATALAKGEFTGGSYIALFPHYIGYPVLLAPFYMLFGSSPDVATLLNVFLSCGISLLIYCIGSNIFDKRYGLLSALIWALWPSQIFYTALVSTEILFTFLMLLCIYLFTRILNGRNSVFLNLIKFIFLGVVCCLTNTIRPLGLIVLIAICLYYFIFIIEKTEIKGSAFISKTIFLSSLLVAYFITSTIVSIATSKVVGREIAKYPFGFNIYVGSNYASNGSWNAEDANTLTEIQKTPGITPQEIHNELLRLSWNRITSRSFSGNINFIYNKHSMIWPVDYESILYIKSGLIQEDIKFDFYKFESLLVKMSNFYYHTILLLCVFGGIILVLKKNQGLPLFLVIIILGIIFLHMIVEVAGRYHFPAISIFSMLASYGICSFSDYQKTDMVLSKNK